MAFAVLQAEILAKIGSINALPIVLLALESRLYNVLSKSVQTLTCEATNTAAVTSFPSASRTASTILPGMIGPSRNTRSIS